jgi:hypothetical protein
MPDRTQGAFFGVTKVLSGRNVAQGPSGSGQPVTGAEGLAAAGLPGRYDRGLRSDSSYNECSQVVKLVFPQTGIRKGLTPDAAVGHFSQDVVTRQPVPPAA